MNAAGFTVKPIGVPTAELRCKIADYDPRSTSASRGPVGARLAKRR